MDGLRARFSWSRIDSSSWEAGVKFDTADAAFGICQNTHMNALLNSCILNKKTLIRLIALIEVHHLS